MINHQALLDEWIVVLYLELIQDQDRLQALKNLRANRRNQND
jgi:hypothetical protein